MKPGAVGLALIVMVSVLIPQSINSVPVSKGDCCLAVPDREMSKEHLAIDLDSPYITISSEAVTYITESVPALPADVGEYRHVSLSATDEPPEA